MDVLLIGYGAIGGHVARALADDPAVRVRWVMARPGREQHAQRIAGPQAGVVTDMDGLQGHPDVALECAGHAGLLAHGAAVLERGIPLGIVSVGALSDDALTRSLEEAAARGATGIHILAGAVGGIDALAAAREGGLDEVVYTSRKPPASWHGTPAAAQADLDTLDRPLVHFEGSARDAARGYPKNANVAATVALAGLGLDHTTVSLVADPDASGNTHRVQARGAFGTLDVTLTGNALPDNPRSSALTAMSALRFLRNRARALRI